MELKICKEISIRLQTYFCARFFRKEESITKSKKGAVMNVASSAMAIANGMSKVDEFFDNENEMSVVYAITRNEWTLLERYIGI